ncbi:MAG: mRNA surveillance protein pelota [Thermoplasmata archaeon]
MRIVDRDDKAGRLRLKIQSIDDLWYLKNILEKGDKLGSMALRRYEGSDDMQRSKEKERIPMYLVITVESVEFHDFDNTLKILGTIVQGPEDVIGSHHSFSISEQDEVDIFKRWDDQSLKMLNESASDEYSEIYSFVTLDDEEANFFSLYSYGVKSMGSIKSGKTGKYAESSYSEKDYFSEIEKVSRTIDNTLIILGPGFVRERLYKYLKERGFKNLFSFPSNRSDEGAVYEFLGTSQSADILKNARLGKDKRIVDEFLQGLSKNMAVYGYEQVKSALEMGSLKYLIISENEFRTDRAKKLLEEAKSFSTDVHIISIRNDPGITILKLGGFAGILRYAIENNL